MPKGGFRPDGIHRPIHRKLGEVLGGVGVSTGGNTLGTTGTVFGPVVLAGVSGVTLSQSRRGNQATITIIASNESAGVAIAAGTQTATTGTVVFSNSNNVTFGLSGQTLTASVAGGIALSAGAASAGAGTVVLSNSNGVTFGMAGSTVTASYSQSTGPAAIAAGTQTATSGTIVFSNSNGVSFGLSGSTRVTASHNGVSELGIQDSAGVGVNQGIPRLIFATSAGANVTFGKSVNANTLSITANVAAVNLAAGTQTATSGTVVLSNSNNMLFGLSNSSIVTAQAQAVAVAAGASTLTSGTLVFSNSNGVSFGLNGATLTASAAGGANTITMSGWENYGAADLNATSMADVQRFVQRVQFPFNLLATEANLIAQVSNSANAGGSITIRMGIYTMAGSTASLASSASRTIGYNSTAAASSYTALSGYRYRSIALGTWSITPGDYMMCVVVSIATSGTSGSYSWKARRNLPLEVGEFNGAQTDNYFWDGTHLTVGGALVNSFRPQDIAIMGGAGAADENDQPWFNMLGTF